MSGEVARNILFVERHHSQFNVILSQRLVQLSDQFHHTSIGTRIPGAVVAYQQHSQLLSLAPLIIAAEAQSGKWLYEPCKPHYQSYNI